MNRPDPAFELTRRAVETQVWLQGLPTQGDTLDELVSGLQESPARISPKYFYDEQGSALYEAICTLQEYYPPRVEAGIFETHRAAIAGRLARGAQLIDLGCADGAKAFRWLEPLGCARYLGVDIAEPWLRDTLKRGQERFAQIRFDGVVTDFTRGFDIMAMLDESLPKIFFYPGSSIGNFDHEDAVRLLSGIRRHMGPDDRLLIGADMAKERDVLIAAYDDALGVTAAFNKNALRAVARELGVEIDAAAFEHRAVFNEAHSRIEMHLVAKRPTELNLPGRTRAFAAGEHIVTEHSYKYSPSAFEQLLREAGLGDVQTWTDERGWFGVFVASAASTNNQTRGAGR